MIKKILIGLSVLLNVICIALLVIYLTTPVIDFALIGRSIPRLCDTYFKDATKKEYNILCHRNYTRTKDTITFPIPEETSTEPTFPSAPTVTSTPVNTTPTTAPGTVSSPTSSVSDTVLKNATYTLPDIQDSSKTKTITLKDGKYTYACTGGQCEYFLVDSLIARGNLTGDTTNEIAVVLRTNAGGTGFYNMLVVLRDVDSKPQVIDTVGFGEDRDNVSAISIDTYMIEINDMIHGKNQSSSDEPNTPITYRYKIENNKLLEYNLM